MSQPVISVENLGKRYYIGHQARHDTLRDRLAHGARGLVRRWRNPGDLPAIEEFWALRDVSFQVNQGDVVGIIGRNGAGKSTLLKILSRITEPTVGRAVIRGRVASLLEVGTGFHPELTGRENIFLNGAILGMSRAEIQRKFDEIVAFAEVERFLDTPVKHYSSGMYVRLAFAVAAHLEPEILIVDEVLAVGDAEFQKRCLGKMRSVARQEGRTVLVVSHNLNQIATLAGKGLLLHQGRTVAAGDITGVIQSYFGSRTSACAEWSVPEKPAATPHLSRIRLQTSEPGNVQAYGRALTLEFELHHQEPVKDACFSFQILNSSAQPAVHLWLYSADRPFATGPGPTRLRCEIPFVRLNVGHYTLRLFFSGPPGSAFFEMTEPDLAFEVVRLDQPTLFGWRSEVCAYFETAAWQVDPAR
ncbi:MAG TPA: polysaccharide ABC transporter ATP-binding protein [Lacunisphaera sp.]|nr:polysaccharide ABC transporter ATP-binding protein [Lacunisphaera sp.]